MSEPIVANRYAKALFDIASDKKLLSVVEQDLLHVLEAFHVSEQFSAWLQDPKTQIQDKRNLFTSISRGMNQYTQNFLQLLIDRNREALLPQIFVAYKRYAFAAQGLVEATVTTAFPLKEEEKKELVQLFQKVIEKQIIIREIVDSDLLGGVIVQVGDRLYDGSLRTKLQRFEKGLQDTKVG